MSLLPRTGDLHQPLHAADHDDSGGNAMLVLHERQSTARPLHAFWDRTVVEKMGRDPQAIAEALLANARSSMAAWSVGTPRAWVVESFAVARDVAYGLPAAQVVDVHGRPAYRLDVNTRGGDRRCPAAARAGWGEAGGTAERGAEVGAFS